MVDETRERRFVLVTRAEKEKFIRESWKAFEDPNDSVSLPDLSKLSDKKIDAMVAWYEYLWQK
jgi:hypothetical protein